MLNEMMQPKQHANAFLFQNNEVRTATSDNGEVWFCAKDVFEALNITWSGATGSLKKYPEKWLTVLYIKTVQGCKDTIFMSEPALYKTIFSSRSDESAVFTEWVCEEVLPSIRKQGFYGELNHKEQMHMTSVMVKLVREIQTNKDAFVFEILTRRLRNLCNYMGETLPDLRLIGQDRKQLPLPM